MLVLGAGGAARAIVHALCERGIPAIVIVNRTAERAEALAARFGNATRGTGWTAIEEKVGAADLIVNTTSLGMKGQPPLELNLEAASQTAIVADIVYSPLATPLLVAARARGLKAVDGLGMLLHQAVPGFEKWFGRRPEVDDELRDTLVEELQRREAAT